MSGSLPPRGRPRVETAIVLSILIFFSFAPLQAQLVAVHDPGKDAEEPTFFVGSFVDYQFSGQLQAVSELIKIEVGNPKGFSLPLSVFAGAISQVAGDQALNASTVADLISSYGGNLNGTSSFLKPFYLDPDSVTVVKISGLASARGISGRDQADSDQSSVVFGGYGEGGVFFQTGAWKSRLLGEDPGRIWVQIRYSHSYLSVENRALFFGEETENPSGFRLDGGLNIAGVIDAKFSVYMPRSGTTLPTLDGNVYKFAFDYQRSP